MEIVVANIHTIDLEALTMLPSMSHLEVAKPGLAVERALLLFVVERIDVLPAGVPAVLHLNALVGQVIEIR